MKATERMQLPKGGGAAQLVQLLAEEAAAADMGARLEATQRQGKSHGAGYSTHNGNRVTGQKVAHIMPLGISLILAQMHFYRIFSSKSSGMIFLHQSFT